MATYGSPKNPRRQSPLDQIRDRRANRNRGGINNGHQHNHNRHNHNRHNHNRHNHNRHNHNHHNDNRTEFRNRQGNDNQFQNSNNHHNHHHHNNTNKNRAGKNNSRNHIRQHHDQNNRGRNRNFSQSRAEEAARLADGHDAFRTFQNQRPVQINFTPPTNQMFTGNQSSRFGFPQWRPNAMDWDTTQPSDLLMQDVSGSHMMLTDRKAALQKGFMTQNDYDRSFIIEAKRLDRFATQRQQAKSKVSEARKKLTETLAARRTWNPILTSHGREAIKVKVSWRHARIPESAKKYKQPISYRSMGDGFRFTFQYPVFAHQVTPLSLLALIPTAGSTGIPPVHPVFSRLQTSFFKRSANTIRVDNEWITASQLIQRKRNHDALIARFKALDARRRHYRATKTQRKLTKTAEDALKAAIYHARLNFNVGATGSTPDLRNPYPWNEPSDFKRVYAALQREIDVQHELFDTKSRLFLFNRHHHHHHQKLYSPSTDLYHEHRKRMEEYESHILKVQSQKVALMKHLNRQSLAPTPAPATMPASASSDILDDDSSPVTARFPALLP